MNCRVPGSGGLRTEMRKNKQTLLVGCCQLSSKVTPQLLVPDRASRVFFSLLTPLSAGLLTHAFKKLTSSRAVGDPLPRCRTEASSLFSLLLTFHSDSNKAPSRHPQSAMETPPRRGNNTANSNLFGGHRPIFRSMVDQALTQLNTNW